VELIAKAAARAAEIILNDKQSKQRDAFSGYIAALSIAILNVAIYLARNGSDRTYRATTFFVNAFVLYVAFRYMTPRTDSPKRGPKARAMSRMKKKKGSEGGRGGQIQQQQQQTGSTMTKEKSFANKLPLGRTIPRAPPARGSELERQLQNLDPNSAEAIRARAAAPASSVDVQPHSFSNSDASTFALRVGPNYKKAKRKAPSGPALYDLVSMDFIYADAALRNTADKFRIPTIPGITDASTGHVHIPPMLIVNTWLPGEEPTMFGGSKNGAADSETYSIPLVFVLSKDTLEQLRDLDNASPGVKLLSEWCRRAENEADFRGRFKCMGMIENIESTGVPKFIQGYNGKPALVTKSGVFQRRENYIEMTINVNMWAFLAKKGLHTLIPTFPDFIFNIGFTIEARKDEEMPEVLLGGCRLVNLDPEKAVVDGVDDLEI